MNLHPEALDDTQEPLLSSTEWVRVLSRGTFSSTQREILTAMRKSGSDALQVLTEQNLQEITNINQELERIGAPVRIELIHSSGTLEDRIARGQDGPYKNRLARVRLLS